MPVIARCTLAAVLVAVTAASSACSAAVADVGARPPGEVRLGLLAPLTGAGAVVGAEYRRGAELAVEVVNSAESELRQPLGRGAGLTALGSARLVLEVRDTAGARNEAETQADQLMAGGRALAVVIADSEEVVRGVSLRAERARVPLVDAATTSLRLTDAGLDWYFRTGPSDRLLAEALLAAVTADGRVPKLAVARPSGDRLGEASAALEDLAAEAGTKVVAAAAYDVRSAPAAAAALTRAKPGVTVVLAVAPGEAAAMVRAVRAKAPRMLIAGLGPGFAGPAFLSAAGRSAAGVLRAEPWSAGFAQRNQLARRLAATYQQRHNAPMTAAAAAGFTAVLTVAVAIDATAATAPAAVRSALVAADVPGSALPVPWSGVRFERGGQNGGARGVVEQVRDGRPRIVSPAELAEERPRL